MFHINTTSPRSDPAIQRPKHYILLECLHGTPSPKLQGLFAKKITPRMRSIPRLLSESQLMFHSFILTRYDCRVTAGLATSLQRRLDAGTEFQAPQIYNLSSLPIIESRTAAADETVLMLLLALVETLMLLPNSIFFKTLLLVHSDNIS